MPSKARIPRGLGLLWGQEERGRRGPEARYTASDVAEAAIRLADRVGLDRVTLSVVAAELGLTTTALYRYVDTKDVLVELMVDTAIGPPPALDAETWQDRATQWAQAYSARVRAHPWLARVHVSGIPRRPGAYAWLDAFVTAVGPGPDVDPLQLALVLDAVVRGFATIRGGAEPPPAWLGDAVSARFPRLAVELARDWLDVEDELKAAVQIVIRGAQASIAPASTGPIRAPGSAT